MQQESNSFDITDLRIPVSLILKKWKIIVTATILCGLTGLGYSFLSTPKYEAATYVNIDFSSMGINVNPISFFYSDPILETVSKNLNIPQNYLPNYFDYVGSNNSKVDHFIEVKNPEKNLYEIIVTDADPNLAHDLANSLAASAIQNVELKIKEHEDILINSQNEVQKSKNELNYFLAEKDLLGVSFVDLALFTGSNLPNVTIDITFSDQNSENVSDPSIIKLTSLERNTLVHLLDQRSDSIEVYNNLSNSILPNLISYQTNPPHITKQASVPEKPSYPKTLFNIIIATLMGGIVVVTVIFLQAWYKNEW